MGLASVVRANIGDEGVANDAPATGSPAAGEEQTATQLPSAVVSAAPPVAGAAPSPAFMAEIYAAAEQGTRLYGERRYAEALPYLTVAAERGFKLPQASLGDIYLNGRGAVAKDIRAGLGWLGVAAEPVTLPRVDDYYRQVLAQLTPDHRALAARLATRYRADYGAAEHSVACEVFGNVIEDLRCRFVDEEDFDSRMRGGDQYADGDYVEELVVTAPLVDVPAPEFGEMPSGEFIAQVYNAANRGSALYREKRYKEALPYLVTAAKRGFKWAQASAADIYLHGRGGVPVDLEAGIGWLGVAAQQRTTNSILQFYEQSVSLLPERFTDDAVEEIVSDYRTRYGNEAHRVACRFAADEGRALSFRFKKLRCHFIDEATQCRNVSFVEQDGFENVQSEWTCRPLEGTRAIDMRRN